MDTRHLHALIRDAEAAHKTARAVAVDHARWLADLTRSGKYTPAHIAAERQRKAAEVTTALAPTRAALARVTATLAQPATSRAAALGRARFTQPAPTKGDYGVEFRDIERATLRVLGDLAEQIAGLRATMTAARYSDDDLRAATEDAIARGDLATLGALRTEARARAAAPGSTSEQRLFAGRIDAQLGELEVPEADEDARLRQHLETVRADLAETLRAAEAGDEDRSTRWQAARAIDPDRPRSHPLIIDPATGAVAVDPREQPAA